MEANIDSARGSGIPEARDNWEKVVTQTHPSNLSLVFSFIYARHVAQVVSHVHDDRPIHNERAHPHRVESENGYAPSKNGCAVEHCFKNRKSNSHKSTAVGNLVQDFEKRVHQQLVNSPQVSLFFRERSSGSTGTIFLYTCLSNMLSTISHPSCAANRTQTLLIVSEMEV